MPVCPKCGFNGQDQDSCERCGVIYARMHTVFDARPANLAEALQKAGPPSRPGGPPSRPGAPTSKPKVEAPAIAHVAIPMPARPAPLRAVPDAPTEMAVSPVGGGPPARSEVTMVPILPPPPEARSRVPVLAGILIACFLAWGLLKYRESREESGAAEAQAVEDGDYYDLAVGSVVSDARMQLRRITDAEAAKAAREALFARERRLRVELTDAPLTTAHRQALNAALDDVVQFLKTDVEAALTHLREAPAPSDDVAIVVAQPPGQAPAAAPSTAGTTDLTALKHANQLLQNLPH